MAYRALEGLQIYGGAWVQYRENRSYGLFYATELYHDTSDCCYSNEPCFGTLPNRGTYYSRGCTVSVHLAEVDCNGRKRTRHWIRVSPTADSDWDADIQASKTYETLQELLEKGDWFAWFGEPMTSEYRHGSLEAMSGLTTRHGSWCQYQWTPESAENPRCSSVFRHEWSERCQLSRSCFEDCDNKCGPTESHDFVLEAGKAERRGHQRYGGGSESHKLFWPHPRCRHEKLQERRNKDNCFFFLVCLCLLWALALELAGYCSHFRGTCPS